MQWNKFHAYSQAVNHRYQNFADRVLSGKISFWDRVRLFFTFVLLLTVLGIVAFFSVVFFVIFGTLAFILACGLMCWSWIMRTFYPRTPGNQLRPRIYIWTSDDLPPGGDSRMEAENLDDEEIIVDVEPRKEDE